MIRSTEPGHRVIQDMPALSALAEAMRVMHGCNLWTSYGAWLEKARPRLGPHAAAMASDAASLHRHLASDPRYTCCVLAAALSGAFPDTSRHPYGWMFVDTAHAYAWPKEVRASELFLTSLIHAYADPRHWRRRSS